MGLADLMTAYSEIHGDLLNSALELRALGHGVNLAGIMRSGIARQIADRWPDILPPYEQACLDRTLTLGGFTTYTTPDGRLIYNLATQRLTGADARIEAVAVAVQAAVNDCHHRGITRLALPRIGTGIGGLDWDDVHTVLTDIATTQPVDIVVAVYTPPTNHRRDAGPKETI